MKVILLKDVKDLGRAHAHVEVSDGHALNYLIPKKMAVAATPGAAKIAESRRTKVIERKELDAELLRQNIEQLAQTRVVVRRKANEQGHLYDAVGATEISVAAKEAHIDLPEDAIKLEKPIKELGTFTVPVSAGEQFGEFSLTVEAE